MRSIIGYIRNLADGLGPPPGSVGVSAKPTIDNAELDLTTHKLGAIERVHVNGGSGSSVLADGQGHFGWRVELSPGPMNIAVTPTDPQTEYRRRFPDESAQIGKAYLTDIERLGWAAGRDCFIWDGVPGGSTPASAANWSTDPSSSNAWGQGNGSIASFGSGGGAGKLTIRKFLAFLGGVVFSVEMGDLVIPVAGETMLAANASGQDRWDLICLWMDIDPASATYGKQRFEFTQGTPGAGIPAFPGNTATVRRLPFMAVKMATGGAVYSAGYDLRMWNRPPAGVMPEGIVSWPISIPVQNIGAGTSQSALNTTLASNETILSLASAWDGMVQLRFHVNPVAGSGLFYTLVETEGRETAGGSVITGTNYVATTLNEVGGPDIRTLGDLSSTSFAGPVGIIFPLRRIPAFTSSNVSSLSRSWSRLRFKVRYSTSSGARLVDQSLSIHLWPVP